MRRSSMPEAPQGQGPDPPFHCSWTSRKLRLRSGERARQVHAECGAVPGGGADASVELCLEDFADPAHHDSHVARHVSSVSVDERDRARLAGVLRQSLDQLASGDARKQAHPWRLNNPEAGKACRPIGVGAGTAEHERLLVSEPDGSLSILVRDGDPTPFGGLMGVMYSRPSLNNAGQGTVGAATPGAPGVFNAYVVFQSCTP